MIWKFMWVLMCRAWRKVESVSSHKTGLPQGEDVSSWGRDSSSSLCSRRGNMTA